MFQAIQSRITGKVVLGLFIAANAVYFAMLSYSIPKLMLLSGGLPLFDMSPAGYSYQEALALLDTLGDEGRRVYLSLQLVLDLFYPILFGISYFALMQWLIKTGLLHNPIWHYISVLPVFVCLADYAENIGIWLMLTRYPDISESLVMTTNWLTIAKSSLTMLYFTGLLSALIFIAIRWLKFKFNKSAG